jgi:hypothetical protein
MKKKFELCVFASVSLLCLQSNVFSMNEDRTKRATVNSPIQLHKKTEKDDGMGFTPKPNAWYRIINKWRLSENESKGAFLDAGGYENAGGSKKSICCSQCFYTNEYTQWRFEGEGSHYKIISRAYENKGAPYFLTVDDNNDLTLTSGGTDDKIIWQIGIADQFNDQITPQFYGISNSESHKSLSIDFKGDVELWGRTMIDQQENLDKIKWMFIK